MQRFVSPPLAGALVLGTLALGACRAVEPTDPTPDLVAATDAWHAERIEELTAPDGWLALVGLFWLEDGPNRVGAAPVAEVSYDGLPLEHVGTLTVDGDRVTFEPASGAAVAGVPDDGVLWTDADGAPTVLAIEGVRFHVIDRAGHLAVRMKDAAAPMRTGFAGIARFSVDPAWRFEAAYVPAASGAEAEADTVIGLPAVLPITGRVRFERNGVAVDAVLFEAGDGGAYLRFGDATNGKETYTIGRYLWVPPSEDGETVVLDFNRAFNPPCSFTPFATCSIPLPSNRFPFPVLAGERNGVER